MVVPNVITNSCNRNTFCVLKNLLQLLMFGCFHLQHLWRNCSVCSVMYVLKHWGEGDSYELVGARASRTGYTEFAESCVYRSFRPKRTHFQLICVMKSWSSKSCYRGQAQHGEEFYIWPHTGGMFSAVLRWTPASCIFPPPKRKSFWVSSCCVCDGAVRPLQTHFRHTVESWNS